MKFVIIKLKIGDNTPNFDFEVVIIKNVLVFFIHTFYTSEWLYAHGWISEVYCNATAFFSILTNETFVKISNGWPCKIEQMRWKNVFNIVGFILFTFIKWQEIKNNKKTSDLAGNLSKAVI